MLQVGDKAPLNVAVKNTDGNEISLKAFLGKYIVVYFYPKDNTPGCTVEACEFRDYNKDIQALGVEIVGVSKDTVKSHLKFIEKFHLNFPLWSDDEHKLMEAFGTWKKKKFMGREYMGTTRSTFIISSKGKIVKVYEEVKPVGHAKEVYDFLRENVRLSS